MGDQLKYLVPDDMIYILRLILHPARLLSACRTSTRRCRSERIALSLRLGKIAVAFEVSGVRTARVPLMGVRDEYQSAASAR